MRGRSSRRTSAWRSRGWNGHRVRRGGGRPIAMAFNPAGLTQVAGTQIYGGIAPVIPFTTFHDPSGAEETTKCQVFPVPAPLRLIGPGPRGPAGGAGHLHALWHWRWHLAFRRAHALPLSVESAVATVTINPTVAYRFFGIVSLAVGVDYMLSRSTASRRLDQFSLGAPDAAAYGPPACASPASPRWHETRPPCSPPRATQRAGRAGRPRRGSGAA